jgi:hypothetical protein
LAGTACVLAGLGLLAIPLRQLTTAHPLPVTPSAQVAAAEGEIHAVLRLRLLAPASRVTIKTAAGATVLDQRNLAAGESEHDAQIPLASDGLELELQADFNDDGTETAVFLTLMPDGYEDQTRYGIGRNHIDTPLRYDWHTLKGRP